MAEHADQHVVASGHNDLAVQDSTGYNPDEPKTVMIAVFAVLSIIALIGSVLFLQYYVDLTKETQTYQKVLAPESVDIKTLREKENAQLGSYGYVDQAKGVARLPIDRAMQLLAEEGAAGKVSYAATSYPVKVAQPNATDGGTGKSPTAAPNAPTAGTAAGAGPAGGAAPAAAGGAGAAPTPAVVPPAPVGPGVTPAAGAKK